jgi:hypothetical protein
MRGQGAENYRQVARRFLPADKQCRHADRFRIGARIERNNVSDFQLLGSHGFVKSDFCRTTGAPSYRQQLPTRLLPSRRAHPLRALGTRYGDTPVGCNIGAGGVKRRRKK